MFPKKIPYHFICIDISTRFTDSPFSQILITARPGVAAPFEGVENHLPSFRTRVMQPSGILTQSPTPINVTMESPSLAIPEGTTDIIQSGDWGLR
jgi:hypothetical protein